MQLKFHKEILLIIKTLIPIFGILFFNWSIGSIFLFFLIELLFIGGETIIKIMFAGASSGGQKISGILRFLLIYSILVIFIFVLIGNFFKGNGPGNMQANFQMEIFYLLVGMYLFDFVFDYLFTKKIKTATTKSIEKEIYYLLVTYFILLLLVLLLLKIFTVPENVNFILGIAIVLARNGAEYFLSKRLKKV